MYQRILVPLDGSKQAESALPLAGKLARIYNAEIMLLRVVEYPLEMYSRCQSYPFNGLNQTDEKLQAEKDAFCKDAEEYLKRLASKMEMSVSRVWIEVQECPVVEAILTTVDKSKSDLIVMSTVGQGESPWMMGAITNRILREAHVPVVLVREESYNSVRDDSHQQETSKQTPGEEDVVKYALMLRDP